MSVTLNLSTSQPWAAHKALWNHLSERLPDLDCFKENWADLCCFMPQICNKMTVNLDRYLTAETWVAYITNCLQRQPYNQMLLYLQQADCFSDYEVVLTLLNLAFDNLNWVNNAHSELFCLKQMNWDFRTFFAEFQQLALESKLHKDSLTLLLKQAFSQELCEMLVHSESLFYEYHAFVQFLQTLKNCHQHYKLTFALILKASTVSQTHAAVVAAPAPALASVCTVSVQTTHIIIVVSAELNTIDLT